MPNLFDYDGLEFELTKLPGQEVQYHLCCPDWVAANDATDIREALNMHPCIRQVVSVERCTNECHSFVLSVTAEPHCAQRAIASAVREILKERIPKVRDILSDALIDA